MDIAGCVTPNLGVSKVGTPACRGIVCAQSLGGCIHPGSRGPSSASPGNNEDLGKQTGECWLRCSLAPGSPQVLPNLLGAFVSPIYLVGP